jgi:putative intracellular protease/amidase
MSFKTLIVMTSNNVLGDTGTAAGSWLEELAAPYFVFTDAGCKVDFASIRGGGAPLDPASVSEPWLMAAGKRLLEDAGVMKRLLTAPALSTIDTSAYDAVFLVGGAATMWDFPSDPAIGKALSSALRAGRIAGAVCHGVSGFLNPGVIAEIAKKRMTCISDREDTMIGMDKILPMMPEGPLRKAGAVMSFADEPFGCNAVRDGNLVTGQNPASAGKAAELILEAMRERAKAKAVPA